MTAFPTFRLAMLAALAAALAAAGCAGPRIDGQWSDPEFAARSLAGRTVLVACRAPDGTLARLCEDRFADALREAGARPVRAPQPLDAGAARDAVARAARDAGADAAVWSSVTVAGVAQGARPSIGVGLGGGFGGGGGISFGGLGVSVPIGGVRPQTAYGASTAVLDAASAREMWSVRATTPTSDDAAVQLAQLAGTSVDAMVRSGLFGAR